jgi:hypothetical protein
VGNCGKPGNLTAIPVAVASFHAGNSRGFILPSACLGDVVVAASKNTRKMNLAGAMGPMRFVLNLVEIKLLRIIWRY